MKFTPGSNFTTLLITYWSAQETAEREVQKISTTLNSALAVRNCQQYLNDESSNPANWLRLTLTSWRGKTDLRKKRRHLVAFPPSCRYHQRREMGWIEFIWNFLQGISCFSLSAKYKILNDQTGLEHSRCGPYVTSNGFRGHLHHLAIMCCNQASDMWFSIKHKLLINNLWLDFAD